MWVQSGRAGNGPIGMPDAASGLLPFAAVTIASVIRPESMVEAIEYFLGSVLACDDVRLSAPNDFMSLVKASSPTTPVMLITASGADPTSDLRSFSRSEGQKDSDGFEFVEIAMGGGAQDDVIGQVQRAARNGDWICLKNVHLVTHWLPELEREI